MLILFAGPVLQWQSSLRPSACYDIKLSRRADRMHAILLEIAPTQPDTAVRCVAAKHM
jgi:hypothetical protein